MTFEVKRIFFILFFILNIILSTSYIIYEDDETVDYNEDFQTIISYEDYERSTLKTLPVLDLDNDFHLFDINLPILNEEIFDNYDNLTSIKLNNNNIRLINTQTFNKFNKSLKILQITSNNLQNFNIEPLGKLETLNLSNNSLKILNNTNYQKMILTTLDVSYNNLEIIHCSNVDTEINLSHNNISNICEFFRTIIKINLSYNNITNIENSTFERLYFLSYLDLSHNKIVNLPYTYHIDTLQFLNLSYNQLTIFDINNFQAAATLDTLDLSYNNISIVLDNQHKFHRNYLKKLYLEGNPIKKFNATNLSEKFTHLSTISLSFSEISCSMLQHHISALHAHVVKGPVRKEHNINGIRCNSSLNTLEDSDKIDSMLYVLERIDAILIVLAVFSAFFVIVAIVVTVKRFRKSIVTF